jgi:protein-tyrosine phosphatase
VYDLHSHILAGLDDGVGTVQESVEFARIACEDGIRVMVATPHIREGRYPNTVPEIESALQSLRQVLAEQGVELRLEAGAEIFLSADLAERVIAGELPTYAGGRYLLLELPEFFMPRQLEDTVFRMRAAGYTAVIAHPERNAHLMGHPEWADELVRIGALMQVTAMSVTGRFGREAGRSARRLLDKGLVHVVASDAHNTGSRPPRLSEARDFIADRYGPDRAQALFVDNPERILAGLEVSTELAQDVQRTQPGLRGLLARLFGS